MKHIETHSEVKYRPYAKHPDYISDLGGSTLNGRALEPLPFDGRLLGEVRLEKFEPATYEAKMEALIKQFQTNFEADGVEGTPTLFINGTKYSNMAYEDLKPILDAELAK